MALSTVRRKRAEVQVLELIGQVDECHRGASRAASSSDGTERYLEHGLRRDQETRAMSARVLTARCPRSSRRHQNSRRLPRLGQPERFRSP
jgi:hypothetical protein